MGLSLLAWFAPWFLLRAVGGRPWRPRLALASLAGLVWSLGTVGSWLYPAAREHLAAGPLAAAALTVAAAWTYGGAYLAGLGLVYGWLPRPRWLATPAAWVLLEQLRTRVLGGAPWALLGHTQHDALPFAQLAELTGVAGLSFLVLLPAAALAEPGRGRTAGLAVSAAALAAAFVFGEHRLRAFPVLAAGDTPPVLTVVSGHNLARDPLGEYLAASAAAEPAPLTIWPEAAVPGYLADDLRTAEAIARAARARGWLLLGAPRYDSSGPRRRYFNSALLFDGDGRLRQTYDKRRLVPFAERSPLPALATVTRPFSPGTADVLLVTERLRVGPLVCWEAVFPELARSYARQGVDVLVNLTSDRDLGAGASQQLAFSRFRAVETRRWLVRASGTGPTLLIDPAGRVHRADTLRLGAVVSSPPTVYVRYGETMSWLSAALLGLLFFRRAANGWPRRGANATSHSGRATS